MIDEVVTGIAYEYRAAKPSHTHAYLYPIVASFLASVGPRAVVLDVGCGNGSFLSLFQNRNWELHGTDLSPTGIEWAQKTFPAIHFFLSDGQAKHLKFVQTYGLVDIVISTEVIEHLYDPMGFLRSCFATMKAGGTLVLSTPYHGYFKNLVLAASGKMDQHFAVLWDHGHIKFWSRKTLTEALHNAGFVNVQFAGSGRLPYLWKSMVLKATKPIDL